MAVQLNLYSRAPATTGVGFSSPTSPDTKTNQAARRIFALLVAALMIEGVHADEGIFSNFSTPDLIEGVFCLFVVAGLVYFWIDDMRRPSTH